ncbi:hypothetical protein IAR50_004060 [Cryptococcus sp. DSM 104548]
MCLNDSSPASKRTSETPSKKFAITPVLAVAQTSLSHASPLIQNPSFLHPSATPGAGPSREFRTPSPKPHAGRISPTKKISRTFGSTSKPALTMVNGRAEIDHRRYGSGDLERGLDLVFARHDKAAQDQDLGGRVPVFSRPKGRRVDAALGRQSSRLIYGRHTKAWSTNSTSSGPFPSLVNGRDDQSDVFTEILTPHTLRSPTAMFTQLEALFEYDASTSSTNYRAPKPINGGRLREARPRAELSLIQQYDKRLSAMDSRAFEEGVHTEALTEENTEMANRIDDLSARIQAMIAEGEDALNSEPPRPVSASSHSMKEDDYIRNRALGNSGQEVEQPRWDLCDALDLAISIGMSKQIELDLAAEAESNERLRGSGRKAAAKRRKDSECLLGERMPYGQAQAVETRVHHQAVRCHSLGLLRYGGVDVM